MILAKKSVDRLNDTTEYRSHLLQKLDNDEDVIGVVGDAGHLLECDSVEGICTRIDPKPRYLKPYRRYAVYFWFRVCVPEKYENVELCMYTRWNPEWSKKGIHHRAKIYGAACIAAGRRLTRTDRITKSMFVGKLFRCALSTVHADSLTAYSVISTVTEKLTG